jgi:hypothetical protein
VDAPDRAAVCHHLAGRVEWGASYVRWLTGVGMESELLCKTCSEVRESGSAVEIVSICEPCRTVLIEDIGDVIAIRGTPEISVMPAAVDLTIVEKRLQSLTAIVDFAAVANDPASWMFVDSSGLVTRVNSASDRCDEVCRIDLPPDEPGHEPWSGHRLTPRLHLSPSGHFAAVVNDYGRNGKVYDLQTGATTATLDGGEYHPGTVPFSCAFVEHDGRSIVIHRTSWNRLDASLAETGQLLTSRGPTSFQRGEEQPEHYLDYFHGAIVPSPDGRLIVDDGWVWHPVGMPMAWSVEEWLRANVWESEDGPSKIDLGQRAYYWDHGLCWLDNHRLAVEGVGDDEQTMIDGARVMSAREDTGSARGRWRTGRCFQEFAGPRGQFFGDRNRLFSADRDGLQIWDVDTGARIAEIDDFRPTRQHRGSRELIELTGRPLRLRVWRY